LRRIHAFSRYCFDFVAASLVSAALAAAPDRDR